MENVHKFPHLNTKNFEDNELFEGKRVSQKHLINALNYINFQDDTILINLKHVKYNQTVAYKIKPLPCIDEGLECTWADSNDQYRDLNSFKFQSILVPDGQRQLLVKSDVFRINENEIYLKLPEECCEVSFRKTQRYQCDGIKAQLLQNSTIFYGSLIDFSPISFKVEFAATPPQTFQWIDIESDVTLILSDQKEMLYAGECRVLKQSSGVKAKSFVLEPMKQMIRRYKPKEFRSTRQELIPSPNIIFRHPFTKKIINLKVLDVAGSGFSVEENANSAVLLPGMIIPQAELDFAGSFKINCKTQVVYCRSLGEGNNGKLLKCGLALLDVDIQDHTKLLSVLQQATDKNSYICNKVDLDALWNFFFESGFIYPKKYAFLQSNKEKIKQTYEKLYTQHPHIARHFIYQDKGRILGHMAMMRFYENSWLIHHHAATSAASNRAGLVVLDQISRFSNSSRSLYSIHMNYLICYFRPENKFPSRVFGGVTRYIKNPKGCSMDTFAYFHYRKNINKGLSVAKPWKLDRTSTEDLIKLENFYENNSGGIMLDALDLEPDMVDQNELSKEYRRLGFCREIKLFSLKKGDSLKAIAMASISNLGLNLSDLTNCIKLFVIDLNDLSYDILHQALSQISVNFEQDEIPVLLYPAAYAGSLSIPYEKAYELWVLNTQYGDSYYKYLNRLLRTLHY
ncbi:PilZ domain-containing protein [Thermodesulfobacteriota bacterium]